MAGGMGRPGARLEDRRRARPDARGAPYAGGGGSAEGGDEACPARHCWVADPADRLGVKRPGLLLEWRSTDGAWEGRVSYVATLRPGHWALVEEWLPADVLTPG